MGNQNSSSAFPSFDNFHAHCEMATNIKGSCPDAFASLEKTLKTPDFDPAKGKYAMVQDLSN